MHHRYTHLFQRVRMLRLLKSGECYNLGEAADALGYSWRQCQRWFASCRQGVSFLVSVYPVKNAIDETPLPLKMSRRFPTYHEGPSVSRRGLSGRVGRGERRRRGCRSRRSCRP